MKHWVQYWNKSRQSPQSHGIDKLFLSPGSDYTYYYLKAF